MLEGRELIVVTGKGGVGRTTVSAALGLSLASADPEAGTVLCEVASQGAIPTLFESGRPDRNGMTALAPGLTATTIDPDETLRAWMKEQFGGTVARTLAGSRSFSQLIAAAPGAAELLAIVKAWELGPDRSFGGKNRGHGTVLLDAPASGHGVAMLRAPRTFADLAAGGPIRKLAEQVWEMLRDPKRCAIVAVAIPAELPVAETIELDGWTREALGRGLDAVIVNRCEQDRFTKADIKAIRAASKTGAIPAEAAAIAAESSARASDQQVLIDSLRAELSCPITLLPAAAAGTRPRDLIADQAELLAEA